MNQGTRMKLPLAAVLLAGKLFSAPATAQGTAKADLAKPSRS